LIQKDINKIKRQNKKSYIFNLGVDEITISIGIGTAKEWKIVKDHPESGYKIASSSPKFTVVADDIYAHHERWKGSGYPRELKAKNIPYMMH